jgi:predicted metalloprotease with PDZ domain
VSDFNNPKPNKMTKKYLIHNFAVIFLIALSALFAQAQTGEVKLTLTFSDRMLDVKIEVPASNLEKTAFTLSDWGGQSNYAENIYRVAARDKNGNALKPEKTAARTWAVDNQKKAFELSYTVVSQKDSFIGTGSRSYFHPTIFNNYAFLWGMTFLFFPDDEKISALPVRLQINPNEYARVYSNFAEKADSFDALSELFVAAGDYRVAEKTIGGRRVRFLFQGKEWKFTDEEFSGTVARMIEAQTKYMGFSPSKDDLLITLTEGSPSSKGGTVVKNVISVYPSPQDGLKDFDTLRLIAHEHFHFWNGSLWREMEGKKEGYYKWMSEGFTEYYSGLTLYREDLITEKQFVAWLNRLLLDYQTNPVAQTATAEVMAEKYWESNDYNRLPYAKGGLLGFLTDLRIRQKTGGKKQIDDLMRLLIGKTDLKKGYDDAFLLANFDAVLETDNRAFYNDFMLGARFLPLVEVLKNSGIATTEQPKEVFELGFTTESGRLERGAKIREVTTPSAIDAGLKAGDELRGFSFNYNQPQQPATFTVQRGGETVPIKYFPKKTVNILQIDENARIPR